MSIESNLGGAESPENPPVSSEEEMSEAHAERLAQPYLSQEEKDALPIVEFTDEEYNSFLATFEAAGKTPQVSDMLELKGIQPDTGFIKLKTGDDAFLIITTESAHYGALEE